MGCSWAGVSVCETDEGVSCKVELMGAACNMGCSWAGVSVCETDEGMSCKVELMELHVTWVALGQESPFVRLTKVCPVRLS